MIILVCDDNQDRGNEALDDVAKSGVRHQRRGIFGADLQREIDTLFERIQATVDGGNGARTPRGQQPPFGLPTPDIVILDNNLAELTIPGARHTAESIAGYIRAFTNIPYIVSLNKNPDIDFDLRYLMGDRHTQADVALNSDHLSIPALWHGPPRSGAAHFQPSYWPVLNDAPNKRRNQIAFVMKHVDNPVLKTLSFTSEHIRYLSRRAKGALSPETEDTSIRDVTFRDFFEKSCKSLPIQDERKFLASKIDSDNHIERRAALTIVARVVAAEIDKWFRADLLGPQEVLVDVPHLLMRMPFLLGERMATLRQWNKTAFATTRPFGLSDSIYRKHLSNARFIATNWTKAACFWWPTLKSNEQLNNMFFDDRIKWMDAVFCEDVSRFISLSARRGKSAPREFAAEFEGAWNRRYAAVVDGRKYAPRSRFAI